MRNDSDKNSRENQNTHFTFNFFLFFILENRAFYVMSKNIVEPGRSQMTIWRMRIECWIHKSTGTHLEYVILIAFTLQQWLHESASMLRYWYIACIVD
jgi:hypothetical protein